MAYTLINRASYGEAGTPCADEAEATNKLKELIERCRAKRCKITESASPGGGFPNYFVRDELGRLVGNYTIVPA